MARARVRVRIRFMVRVMVRVRAGKHLRTATPNYPEEGLRTREVAPASGHTACERREARTRGFGV